MQTIPIPVPVYVPTPGTMCVEDIPIPIPLHGSTNRNTQTMTQLRQLNQPEHIPEPRKIKPDANMCLKYTFGVNAWKQWVLTKNAEIEKSGTKRRPLKQEILQMTADEFNYLLSSVC